MALPQIQELLEAGVHFGHQTSRWNPKMRKFIFAERNGIYIIDLKKTLRQIELAQELTRAVVSRGDRILFVCTKKQLKPVIESAAERSGSVEADPRPAAEEEALQNEDALIRMTYRVALYP